MQSHLQFLSVVLGAATWDHQPAARAVGTSTTPAGSTAPRESRLYHAPGNDGDSEIYVMAADGRSGHLTRTRGRTFDPACSPGGTRIAFTVSRDGNLEIYAMNADGSARPGSPTDPARISRPPGPRWHAHLLHHQTGGPLSDLRDESDGSDQVSLSGHSLGGDRDPDWSPTQAHGLLILGSLDRRISAAPETQHGPTSM